MKNTLVGCLIGICLGFGFASFLKPAPAPIVTNQKPAETLAEAPEKEPPKEAPKFHSLGLRTVHKVLKLKQEEPVNPKQHLKLDISDEQISTLEENLPELQKDVSLYRENEGWSVRFHQPTNILSNMGLKDSDLIRFSSLQEMKQDPSKQELISRLEQVLHQLER